MKKILSVVLLFLSFICFAHSPEPSHQVKSNDVLITAPTSTIKVVLNSTTDIVCFYVKKVADISTYCKTVDEDVADVGFNIRKHSYKTLYNYQSVLNSKYNISVRVGNHCRDFVRV